MWSTALAVMTLSFQGYEEDSPPSFHHAEGPLFNVSGSGDVDLHSAPPWLPLLGNEGEWHIATCR